MTIDHSKIKKVFDIPEEYRIYLIEFHDGEALEITGRQKQVIEKSSQQFFTLPTGELINKSAIKFVRLNKDKTKETYFKAFPQLAPPNLEKTLPGESEITNIDLTELKKKLIKGKSF